MYKHEQTIPIEGHGDEHCLAQDWGFDVWDHLKSRSDVDSTTICWPLIYNGVEYWDYGVCKRSGFIYSNKSGYWNILKPNVSGKNPYPKLGLSHNTYVGSKSIPVHIAVMETLNPLPVPKGVTAGEWECTPDSVKKFCRKAWFVNHIDHDKCNFMPDNLEWSTAKQNAQAYQQFKLQEAA